MKLSLRAFSLLILAPLWCASALALTIPASEDTSGGASGLSTESNGASSLSVDATNKAFLYFDLSEIPPTSVVRWAKLRMFLPRVDSPGNGLGVYVVSGTWDEATASNNPTVSAVPVATIAAGNLVSKRFVTADVTGVVQQWISGGTHNEGFAIGATAGSVRASLTLASKEGASSGLPAELDIDFQPEPLAASSVTLDHLSGSLKTFLTPAFVKPPSILESGSLGGAAQGVGNLSYQWYLNGSIVAGATGASIPATGLSDGSYKVVVSNGIASGTSASIVFARAATLPKVTSQPAVVRGGTLTVSGSGGVGAFGYQWFRGATPVPGASGTLAVIPLSAGVGSGSYMAKLSNAFGIVSSGTVYFDRSKYEKITYSFARIPAGSYQRGNVSGDSDITNAPVQTVSLSAFYIAEHCTTKAEWDVVRTWALSRGYTDLVTGGGKASDHPVQSVNWYDVVKWINAASEKDGLTPCYRVAGSVLKTGSVDAVVCDWSATGYRLPTEAEWEIAARGGLTGKRFPNRDKISQSQANYKALKGLAYDDSQAVNGYSPLFAKDGKAYTSPLESFAANGYGLYDMDGNVCQWCWDRFGDYVAGADPRGASTGSRRVFRGGSWDSTAIVGRCAYRSSADSLDASLSYCRFSDLGFRLARRSP